MLAKRARVEPTKHKKKNSQTMEGWERGAGEGPWEKTLREFGISRVGEGGSSFRPKYQITFLNECSEEMKNRRAVRSHQHDE